MGSGVGPSSCVRVKDSAHYFIHKVNSFNECSERDKRKTREESEYHGGQESSCTRCFSVYFTESNRFLQELNMVHDRSVERCTDLYFIIF